MASFFRLIEHFSTQVRARWTYHVQSSGLCGASPLFAALCCSPEGARHVLVQLTTRHSGKVVQNFKALCQQHQHAAHAVGLCAEPC